MRGGSRAPLGLPRPKHPAKEVLFRFAMARQRLLTRVFPILAPAERRKARWMSNESVLRVLRLADEPWYRWPEDPVLSARQLGGTFLPMCGRVNPRQMAVYYFVRPKARFAAATCVVAVCGYRAAHGRLPERLEDLVPEFLPSVPIDPYDTKAPLRYNPKTPWGPVIYSVSTDRKDDKGVVSAWPVSDRTGDWTFPIPVPNETWQTYQKRRDPTYRFADSPPTSQPTASE